MYNQLQAWEVMLSQHAMHWPITGWGNDAIPACNSVKTLPIKEPENLQKLRKMEGDGRDFSGSLARAIGKPLSISAQSS